MTRLERLRKQIFLAQYDISVKFMYASSLASNGRDMQKKFKLTNALAYFCLSINDEEEA
jgi:hypothetical protein